MIAQHAKYLPNMENQALDELEYTLILRTSNGPTPTTLKKTGKKLLLLSRNIMTISCRQKHSKD
jgi:hypothetical protein